MKALKSFLVPFKGFVIGSSMTVPGVSGGTMAILLGIYDQLIGAISHFGKAPKKNLLFLLKFCVGAVIGFAALASAIGWLLATFPIPVSLFFLGAIIGGVPALYRKTRVSKFTVSSAVYILLGFAIVIGIGILPQGLMPSSTDLNLVSLLIWLLAGVVVALALVLPGISTSHMLLVLGIYGTLSGSIDTVALWVKTLIKQLLGDGGVSAASVGIGEAFTFIGLLGVSTLVGVVLITRPLEWTMKKFPHQTYCMILGFVVGSLADIAVDIVWPALQVEATLTYWLLTAVASVVTAAAGFAGILFLSRFSDEE
ncbi:MAG: DUF368 domain-containing protein [Clostridia bacterium]|nr:DUF368 domain-containing protein [Clostridia bacterium]